MKNSPLSLLALLCFLLFASTGKTSNHHLPEPDSTHCLEIEGVITNALEGDGECVVELICANTVLDSLVLKEGKRKFRFLLQKNSFYAIRVSKAGYVPKLVCIDTKLDATPDDGLFRFIFNTELMAWETALSLNQDALDFPVAMISYHAGEERFSHSREYSNNLRRELYSGSGSRSVVIR